MTAMDTLRAIAANPAPELTAKQTIEARIGRNLGPVADLPPDLKTAIKLLAIQRIKNRGK
jgi:hypothetical protein